MYERIFGKYPQVKVLNYVLINPERSYSKKEIADINNGIINIIKQVSENNSIMVQDIKI